MDNPKLKSTYSLTMPTSTDELRLFYDEWADNYNEDYKKFGYKGPRLTALTLADYLPDKNAKILDLGCGTGMVGEQLLNCGFTNIHGLDMSNRSLHISEEKQIYKIYICSKIDGNPIDIRSNTYDALTTCGTFIPNHLNQSCFPEMIRIIKPGGVIVIMMREEYLWKADEFKNNELENAICKMVDKGKWKVLLRKRFSNFFHDKDGLVFVFQNT